MKPMPSEHQRRRNKPREPANTRRFADCQTHPFDASLIFFRSKALFDKEAYGSAPLLGRRLRDSMQPNLGGVTRLAPGNDNPAILLAKPESDDLDDEGLINVAAVGRTEAHAAIWDRYAPRVRSFVRRSIRLESDVEDLVQEVFLQFYRSHTLLRNQEALRAFIYTISYRVIIREIRFRRARKRTEDGMQAPGSRFIPPADFEAREAIEGIRAWLDRLDPTDRTAFLLRHVDGLELSEIAGMLDISLATVKRRLAKIARRVHAMTKNDQRLVEYGAKRSGPGRTGCSEASTQNGVEVRQCKKRRS
jgi:RNA polymerase sigma-70 factor, ECF subfamily